MASGVYIWSQTASSNASADAAINWSEGQAPSSVNDSGRAMMAVLAKYRDDISGAITTGGTSTAYTVASNSSFDSLAHMNGQVIAFTPNATSTNAAGVDVTLNVDGLGAKSIRLQTGVALPSGTLILGTPYVAVYSNADSVFYLRNMTSPYSVPLGGMLDFIGSTTPNSSFVFPIGQAISRTTYATLFSAVGTTYGVGDGSSTFNVPDLTGRIVAMKEASATRLTSTYFGGNSTTLGAVGGAESQTLTLAQLPTGITSNGTVTVTPTNLVSSNAAVASFSAPSGVSFVGQAFQQAATVTVNNPVTGTGTYTSNNTSGNPHPIVQPTIVLNKILRII